jgi:hypothetical protein
VTGRDFVFAMLGVIGMAYSMEWVKAQEPQPGGIVGAPAGWKWDGYKWVETAPPSVVAVASPTPPLDLSKPLHVSTPDGTVLFTLDTDCNVHVNVRALEAACRKATP